MENKALLKRALFLGVIFGWVVASYATEVDCTTRRVAPDLCIMLNQANADSDTFSVSIFFFQPGNDTSEFCRNRDPKLDTDGRCSLGGYDSAYYAKLKSNAHIMFTKFELWDANHPTVRLTPPDSGRNGYMGIVATKATLIEVLKEGYVATMEDWEERIPNHIISHASPRIQGMRNQGKSFLPNGRVISAKSPIKGRSYIR
jgi:hypothetical protein